MSKHPTESTEARTCTCEVHLCGSDNLPALPRVAPSLPQVAVSRIFELSTIPVPFLDPTSALMPRSLWAAKVRRIRALSSVCKDWHFVGCWSLYDHICISRAQQLPLLVRSLVNNITIRKYVNTLTLYALVEHWQHYDTFACLGVLFSLCPNLSAFHANAPWPFPEGSVIPAVPARLTHLTFNNRMADIPPSSIFAMLKTSAPHLQSLSLISLSEGPTTTLHFPELKSFTLQVAKSNCDNLNCIRAQWSFPKLVALTLQITSYKLSETQDELSTPLRSFCSTFGSTVRYLRISAYDVIKCIDSDLLAQFPHLEHLVLPPQTVGDLTHPTVQFIDIWTLDPWIRPSAPMCEWEETYSKLNQLRFPSLRYRRTLPRSLMHLVNLPHDISPLAVPKKRSPPLVFDYEGLHVRAEFGRVVVVSDPDWGDDDDESDSESEFFMSSESEVDECDEEDPAEAEGGEAEGKEGGCADDDNNGNGNVDEGDMVVSDPPVKVIVETGLEADGGGVEDGELEADPGSNGPDVSTDDQERGDNETEPEEDQCSSTDEDYEYWEETDGSSTGSNGEELEDLEFSGLWYLAA